MLAGLVRFFWVGAIAVLAAACVEGTATGPGVDISAAPGAAIALAFEPVAGVPGDRSAVLAEALVSGVVERGVAVVPRDSDHATYHVRGDFSAARLGNATEVTYAWSIVDRAGAPVHRIAGTESVQAALPDPWQAVTDDALRRIAARSVDELDDWLSRGAPATSGLSEGARPAESVGGGITALLAATEPPARATAAGGPKFHVGAIAGVSPEGSAALARAMAARLMAAGGAWAANPAEADYVVSGEATVGPAHNARQTVAIIWSVDRPAGESLGTVRQVRHVRAGSLEGGWGASADGAAGAAAPGVLALMHAQ